MSLPPLLTSLFTVLRLLAVGLHLLSGVLQVALLFRFLNRLRRRLLRQLWSRQLLFLLGVHLEPTLLDTADPVRALEGLIVSNHVSFLDIFVINARVPSAFVCHGALFQSAIDAGVPVVCLALSYHDRCGRPTEAAAYTGDLSLLQCLWQIAAAGGLRVHLQVLPPLTGLVERRHLAQHAQYRISQALTRRRLLPE